MEVEGLMTYVRDCALSVSPELIGGVVLKPAQSCPRIAFSLSLSCHCYIALASSVMATAELRYVNSDISSWHAPAPRISTLAIPFPSCPRMMNKSHNLPANRITASRSE